MLEIQRRVSRCVRKSIDILKEEILIQKEVEKYTVFETVGQKRGERKKKLYMEATGGERP
jgi:hypothetical protein